MVKMKSNKTFTLCWYIDMNSLEKLNMLILYQSSNFLSYTHNLEKFLNMYKKHLQEYFREGDSRKET